MSSIISSSKSVGTLLVDDECLAKILLIPNDTRMPALCQLRSPKISEIAESPLAYIVGGIQTQFRKEAKDFRQPLPSSRACLKWTAVVVAALVVTVPLVVLFHHWGVDPGATGFLSVIMNFAIVTLLSSHLLYRLEYQTETYQRNAEVFRERMTAVTKDLAKELESTAYTVEISPDDEAKDQSKKLIVKIFPSGAFENEHVLPPPSIEGEPSNISGTTIDANLLGLLSGLANSSIDKWMLGGLSIKLRATEERVAKCKNSATHYFMKPLGALMLLGILVAVAVGHEYPWLFLTYLIVPVVLLLLVFLVRWFQECFDMKNLHAANALVVEEVSRDLAVPRSGHRMVYEVRRSNVLPKLFTMGVIRFEVESTV